MFQYYYRILDKYEKPITAFAIFADANKNFHPKHYQRDFLGTKLYYTYNTYKIIEQDDIELEASNNLFAMAVLAAKLALSNKKLEDQQMSFLRYYLNFESNEMFA